MLRRPATAITITEEDIAAYETRRLQREYDARQKSQREYDAKQKLENQQPGNNQELSSTDSSFDSSQDQAQAGVSRNVAETQVPTRDTRTTAERIGITRVGR
ncbi:MAG: hypothetical protein M1820_007286 [Bogoriella megaspora]|nr:MAG: hypothetical protein M1820_007286 [Bogoriella megaspora]